MAMDQLDPATASALLALLAIASAQNFATAGLIAASRDGRASGAWVLSAFHLVVALVIAGDIANAFGLYDVVPLLAAPSRALALLLAPMLYLGVRRLSFACAGPTRRDWPHFAPAILAFALLVPHIALNGDAADDGAAGHVIRRAAMLALIAQGGLYLVLATRVIARDKARLRDVFSFDSAPDARRIAAMLLLVALSYTALVAEFAARVVAAPGTAATVAGAVLRLLCFLALALLPLTARRLLPDASPAADPRNPKYHRSALDPAAAERIAGKLHLAMERDSLHADPSLTLGDLAERLGATPHKLSQVLNERLGTSFYDYVNGWRVERARALLAASPSSTILTVALECGFNSKSTFNAAFRKATGTTPSRWRDDRRATAPAVEGGPPPGRSRSE